MAPLAFWFWVRVISANRPRIRPLRILIMTDAAATRLAAKLKTPLQIGQHLVRAFEAGFEVGAKPVDETVVEAVLSLRIDDLEPRLTRSGYDVRSLAEQFDAKPAEIRRLLRGDLDPARSRELMDEMRAAGEVEHAAFCASSPRPDRPTLATLAKRLALWHPRYPSRSREYGAE